MADAQRASRVLARRGLSRYLEWRLVRGSYHPQKKVKTQILDMGACSRAGLAAILI